MFMSPQGSAALPSTVGTKPAPTNYGSVDTYGVEISLGWKDNIGKDFKYWVKLNTGYSDNKVKKMYWPSLLLHKINNILMSGQILVRGDINV